MLLFAIDSFRIGVGPWSHRMKPDRCGGLARLAGDGHLLPLEKAMRQWVLPGVLCIDCGPMPIRFAMTAG